MAMVAVLKTQVEAAVAKERLRKEAVRVVGSDIHRSWSRSRATAAAKPKRRPHVLSSGSRTDSYLVVSSVLDSRMASYVCALK